MTAQFKQTKTPRLEIVVQITETTAPGATARSWEVHDVERNRGFLISLAKPPASADEAAVFRAIGTAIERALQTPPEKIPGQVYPLELNAGDF